MTGTAMKEYRRPLARITRISLSVAHEEADQGRERGGLGQDSWKAVHDQADNAGNGNPLPQHGLREQENLVHEEHDEEKGEADGKIKEKLPHEIAKEDAPHHTMPPENGRLRSHGHRPLPVRHTGRSGGIRSCRRDG